MSDKSPANDGPVADPALKAETPEPDTAALGKKRHSLAKLSKSIEDILILGVLCCLVISSASIAEVTVYPLELFYHFRLQIIALSALAVIVFVFWRRYFVRGLLALLCLAMNLIEVIPYYTYVHRENDPLLVAADNNLRLLVANVLTANQNHQQLLNLVRNENPDIAAFIEVNQRWQENIATLTDIYPHSISIPREDNFGIHLISKVPLLNPDTRPLGKSQPPTVTAQVMRGERRFNIIAAHTLPPRHQWSYLARNEQLDSIARFISISPDTSIVLGDLNISPWSPIFKRFLNSANLRDAKLGHGVLPTWPTHLPLLYTPIDHCLLGGELQAERIKTLPVPGSDHLALVVDLKY